MRKNVPCKTAISGSEEGSTAGTHQLQQRPPGPSGCLLPNQAEYIASAFFKQTRRLKGHGSTGMDVLGPKDTKRTEDNRKDYWRCRKYPGVLGYRNRQELKGAGSHCCTGQGTTAVVTAQRITCNWTDSRKLQHCEKTNKTWENRLLLQTGIQILRSEGRQGLQQRPSTKK